MRRSNHKTAAARHKKTTLACARVVLVQIDIAIGSVRLRLQPAFGLAALGLVLLGAGARNGRMPRRRIVAGIARRLLALQEALDLVAGQGLVFEQAFRQRDELVVLFREDTTGLGIGLVDQARSEEHTSELQSLMRISY